MRLSLGNNFSSIVHVRDFTDTEVRKLKYINILLQVYINEKLTVS